MSHLKLMQVGNVMFHLHDQKVFQDYNVKGSSKEQSLLLAPYKSTQNTQWLNKTISLKATGVHVHMKNSYNADEILSKLRMWVGKPTFLFAYDLNNMFNHGMIRCACESDCKDNCDMTFLQTYGILDSVDFKPDTDNHPPTLSLSFTILDFWREIDNYTWQWHGSSDNASWSQSSFGIDNATYVPNNCDDYYSVIPNCNQIFSCGSCEGWQFRDWEQEALYYDELFWYDQYNTSCSGRSGGQSNVGLSTLNVWHEVFCDSGRWNAPPLSAYSISGLPNTGVLSITVERRNGLTNENVVSSLDLDALQTDFTTNGDGTFEISDRIIVGDIRRYVNNTNYRPSFVEDYTGTIQTTKPKWSYQDWFPGMLSPDWSRFSFSYSGSGDISNFNAAYIHHFRRM